MRGRRPPLRLEFGRCSLLHALRMMRVEHMFGEGHQTNVGEGACNEAEKFSDPTSQTGLLGVMIPPRYSVSMFVKA